MTVIRRNSRIARRSNLTMEACEARVLLATVPPLGMAASFAVLGGSTVTDTGATSIVGDVGVSPGTSITGFPPGSISGGALHAGDALATQAAADLATAYGDLKGEPVDTILSGQNLGGKTLTPGVYNFGSSAQLSGALTFDAQGDSNAVFVIQIGTTLTTATNSSVALIDGAHASNIFWQVGSSATIGTGSALQGSILAYTSIVLNTGASVSPGRALAINAAVTLDTNAVSSNFSSLLTITADDQTSTYGSAIPPLTASYSGFINGDTFANLTTLPSLSTTATASSPVGTYNIIASGAVDPYYTFSYVVGHFTITKASLTITAKSLSTTYGSNLPALTAIYTGFVNGDTSASLSTKPTLTTSATATSDVSNNPYSITVTGGVDPNYTIIDLAGNLTVNPAPLTITAVNQTRLYGQANPTFTASYSGFVLGQDASVLAGTLGFATPANQSTHFGIYPVAVGGLSSPLRDYLIQYVGGGIAITPAPLTITAPSLTKVYGQAVPTLAPSYAGFVNGDSAARLTTPAILTTPLSVNSHVGFYPIVASGATSMDYAITEDYGISAVFPSILIATPGSGFAAYGQAVPSFAISYAGFVNGDTAASLITQATATTSATAGSLPGFYPVIARGGSSYDYAVEENFGILDILPPAPASPTSDPGLSAFVASLYEDLLGRAPEPFGLGQWVNLLDQGETGAAVDQQIYSSPEAVAYRASHPGQTVSLAMALTDAQAAQQRV